MTTRPDIVLNNGRVVQHKPMDNGAQWAVMADGGAMSSEEWQEYCDKLRNGVASTALQAKRDKHAASKAAFAQACKVNQ